MSGSTGFSAGSAHGRFWRAMPLIASCALLSSSCSAANSQSWQCHAPEGKFDTHDIAVAQNITQVTGEMMIRKANGLSQWNPTAKVAFTDLNSGGPECHCNGIIATWHPEYPDSFEVKLAVDGKNESLGFVPYDKPVKFKLTFAWNGALKLEVGTQVATGMAPTPIRNNLELSCSTADVDFNLTVVPPPPPSAERCAVAAREQWSSADFERYCRPPATKG
ncbi:MAG: hypothetical protein ABIO86_16285 [Sphingomonas sp.]